MARLAPSLLIAIAALLAVTDAAVFTVLWVPHPATTTETLPSGLGASVEHTRVASAIGTVESGMTRYVVNDIASNFIVYLPGLTTTAFAAARTVATYTIDEGNGNIIHQVGDPYIADFPDLGVDLENNGMDVECTLDVDKKQGVCQGTNVRLDVLDMASGTQIIQSTRTQTIQTTYTADVLPLATATSASGAYLMAVPAKTLIATLASMVLGVLL